jgi:hypothetical protein
VLTSCAGAGAHWQRVTDDTYQASLGLFPNFAHRGQAYRDFQGNVSNDWSWFDGLVVEQVQLQLTVHL